MGQIANELAAKHDLKNPNGYQSALDELNEICDAKLIGQVDTTVPKIRFQDKERRTNEQNNAELVYPTSADFNDQDSRFIEAEFSTHPQVNGLMNATISLRGSAIIITTPLDEAQRFEQKEEILLKNVLEVAWKKLVINIQSSANATDRDVEVERSAEKKALEFLKG
ncbi:MAG: hypothetical protein WBO32_09365 [Cyclobacteriaceae bacterium]